jgi:hypothetical protein
MILCREGLGVGWSIPQRADHVWLQFWAMHPNLLALVALMGVALSLLAGKLVAYGMEKALARRASSRCPHRGCGELGWVVRRDTEAFHAFCVKCRWMSHFTSGSGGH